MRPRVAINRLRSASVFGKGSSARLAGGARYSRRCVGVLVAVGMVVPVLMSYNFV